MMATKPVFWLLGSLFLAALAVTVATAGITGGAGWRGLTLFGTGMILCLVVASPRAVLAEPAGGLATAALLVAFSLRAPANELAGVLTLIVPPSVLLALAPSSSRRCRLLALLCTAAAAGLLATTSSRAGILAVVAALGVAPRLAGPHLARRGLVLLGAGGLLLGLAGGLLGPRRLIDFLVLGGSARRTSLESLLTGRLEIWDRAGQAILDFPWTGLGFGGFESAVRTLYPLTGFAATLPIEDAHQLVLETALTLGLPGLAGGLVLWGLALVQLLRAGRASPPDSSQRTWAAGLAGSFLAHGLYSLVDAVAPGTVGSLGAWWLLGAILALPRPSGRTWSRRWTWATAGSVMVAVTLTAATLEWSVRHNHAAVLAASALLTLPEKLPRAAAELDALPSACRLRWLRGLVAHAQGDDAGARTAWTALLRCSSAHLEMLQVYAAGDRELAQLAVELQPHRGEAFFWLARLNAPTPRARELYAHGLALAPEDGRAWFELATLLDGQDDRAAENAYREACHQGDPGANACWRAGQKAERRGDVDEAIRYYRKSRWPPAHDRAGELETYATRSVEP